ncbi:hypothetical protein [Clostridium sartagoforme]|uniref:hypothetical protein n=1 Tax=Clostridium sartagoforme TaxID=84031 RepID=UPI0031CE10F5
MSRTIFEIVDDNFYECKEVSKQILWMYDEIISNWGIGHDNDYEQVNYDKYIMCKIAEERLKTPDIQRVVDLVNDGCFTALSCYVSDLMDEERRDNNVNNLIIHLLEDQRINSMEFEKELLTLMHNALMQKPTYQIDKNLYWTELPDGKAFYNKLKEVYIKYVIGYYQSNLEIAKINIDKM